MFNNVTTEIDNVLSNINLTLDVIKLKKEFYKLNPNNLRAKCKIAESHRQETGLVITFIKQFLKIRKVSTAEIVRLKVKEYIK